MNHLPFEAVNKSSASRTSQSSFGGRLTFNQKQNVAFGHEEIPRVRQPGSGRRNALSNDPGIGIFSDIKYKNRGSQSN